MYSCYPAKSPGKLLNLIALRIDIEYWGYNGIMEEGMETTI